jgi:hypothetical protein
MGRGSWQDEFGIECGDGRKAPGTHFYRIPQPSAKWGQLKWEDFKRLAFYALLGVLLIFDIYDLMR